MKFIPLRRNRPRAPMLGNSTDIVLGIEGNEFLVIHDYKESDGNWSGEVSLRTQDHVEAATNYTTACAARDRREIIALLATFKTK